jgi:hypothetical protein
MNASRMILLLLVHPWIDDCKCQEPTSHKPKTIVADPRHACATTMEMLKGVCSVTVAKPSREGNITSRKDPAFIETAISIVMPCQEYLRFRFRPKLVKSMRIMTI